VSDLAFRPAVEQAELVRRREVSARELVDLYLDRIDELDAGLNSYVHVLADRAREIAAERDEQTVSGDLDELPPFHGVPVAIKELNFLEGVPATLACRSMASFVAPFSDESVARLLGAGMVPLGKTNSPELGTVPITEPDLYGPCRNPWEPTRTPGGSSGGAAAALAAGLCPVAQGSDGGGSIRIPAAHCGLFGLKPSRDRVSRAPLFGDHGFGLVTDGVLTRTVADSAALLDVLAGYVPGDPGIAPPPERPFAEEVGTDPGVLRIGVAAENPVGELAAPVAAAIDSARDLLEEVGHDTVDVALDVSDEAIRAFGHVWQAVIASQPIPPDTLEPMNRWYVERGRSLTAPEYLREQFRLQLHARRFVARFHDEFDVLLLPVFTRLPYAVGELDDLEPGAAFRDISRYVGATPLVNASGQPAAAVPLHWDEDTGVPIGVQFVGRAADEATLIRLCAQLEAVRPWADRRPPGFD
jgi:amidase